VVSQAIQKSAGTVSKPAERFYFPELDLLRFFAFFAVFIHHWIKFYDQPGVLGVVGEAGAFGVDLFFTLSGYLITRLLLRERDETGDINLKAFYVRRTLRIWPLYYFSIALAFLLSQLPMSITSAPPFVANIFGSPMPAIGYLFMATFVYNFNFYGTLLTNPPPLMGQLWSLSVEEQFYLFWPWFARYMPRRRVVVVPILMIAIACVVRATLKFDMQRLMWNYTFVHLDPIAVGILIALLPALNLGRGLRLLLLLVGIASWGFAAGYCGIPIETVEYSTLKISLGFPAIALGSGAFLLATLGTKSLNPSSRLVGTLMYLGKISYGLYMYNTIATNTAHLLQFRGALRLDALGSWSLWTESFLAILISFGLNVAMAAASYRWLESPFLRMKERFARVPSRAV
jgi:peptidoglycan/LPS O-acetylase OafA/YrhL